MSDITKHDELEIQNRIFLYSQLNKSEETKKSYKYSLIDFIKYLADKHKIELPEDKSLYMGLILPKMIKDGKEGKLFFTDQVILYMEHLKSKKQAARTIVMKLSAIKHYITTLKTLGNIDWDISSLPGPRVEKSDVEGPNEKIFAKILHYVDNLWKSENYIARRNALAIYMLGFCGLRESEVVSIKIENINYDKKVIKSSKKGYRTEQETRVPDLLFSIIDQFIKYDGRKEGYLFVGKSEINPSNKMDRTTLWRIVKAIGKKCGVPELHPHAFRHFFTSEALEAAEQNTRLAMKATGHKSEKVFNDYEQKRRDDQGVLMNKIEKKWRRDP